MLITLKDDGMVELTGHDGITSLTNVKYWEGYGLPSFEGPLEGFEKEYPEVIQELVERKVLKKND